MSKYIKYWEVKKKLKNHYWFGEKISMWDNHIFIIFTKYASMF